MTLTEFKDSITQTTPPPALLTAPLPVQALWHDISGDWATAHKLVQSDQTLEGAWVHAYLHRKEGDQGNAAYWYGRAQQPVATGELLAEAWTIVSRLLAD